MENKKSKDLERFFPLVEKIAYKYKNSGVDLDDLKQQGMIGLIEAFHAYDFEQEATLFSFVSKYIEGSILHYLRDKAPLIRYPRWFIALSRKIEKYMLEFKKKNNRIPTIEEISNELNIQKEGIKEFFRFKKILNIEYLDEDNQYNLDYNSLRKKIQHISYENFKLPIEDVITLYEAIDRLSDLKKKIIRYLFLEGYTQKEAAKKAGISVRHISRLKKEALEELRDELKE